jgi:transcriptional regulator with XRE-family HTH domain
MSGNLDEFRVIGPHSFGLAIREFRDRRGVTQQELADRADVHRSYLSELETGHTTEAVNRIIRMLTALDLEVVIRERPPR